MAIGSVLNPERIVGKQNINQKLAKNFISGDSFLGTSSIASAANKIVGFQRGTTKPVPSSVDLIVNTISTNITNNITSTLNNTLQSFTVDYKKRVSDVDSAKPTGILSKFLSTYKSVIQFIQFFGNKKFVNGISDNLKNLSKSFTESFEVAKLIRQVIVKIVQQLSNLPKASPGGGGGIDIDVDVPMGGVRKSAPRGLGNMFKGRGKMLALGAGALGLGAVGAGTVNALSNVDEIRAGMFQPGDGGDIISTFGSAIERFIAAINTMVGIGKGSKPPGGGGGGGGSPGGGGGGSGSGGMPNYTGSAPVADVSKDTEFLEEVKKLAAETGAKPSELLALYQAESGISPTAKNSSGATGIFQLMFDPKNPNDKRYGKTREEFASMSRADQVKAHRKYLEEVGFFSKGYKGLTNLKVANIAPAFLGKGLDEPMYRSGSKAYEGNKNIDMIYGNKDGIITANEYNNFVMVKGNPKAFEKYDVTLAPEQLGKGGPDLPDYMLPPEKRDQYKNLATNVSQPAQSAVQSQTNIVPIDLSGAMPQQSQGGGGGVSAPPSTQKNGPSVPLLPSANTDNFLVLYSRMVYNIVDG
jgi:hypothetical protein